MKSVPQGCSIQMFLARKRRELPPLVRKLPDAIEIRQVANLEAIPQARADFTLGAGSRTTVTLIPIDHRRARQCK